MVSNNTPHIKNPLTIIAIFAGIAEVSGTTVIAFLQLGQQEIFIWFLIFFPTLLIVLFFITLNFNPKVLYAPSDFENQDHFMTVHKYDRSSQRITTESVIVDQRKDLASISNSERRASVTGTTVDLVSVSNFHNAKDFIAVLKKSGYVAEVYDSIDSDVSDFENHESIWIGKNIAAEEVVDILKKSVKFYPHLKYMHISADDGQDPPDYVHGQMYIGGSTSTSKDRYGISSFRSEDILSLSESISKKDLYKFVRSYYSK